MALSAVTGALVRGERCRDRYTHREEVQGGGHKPSALSSRIPSYSRNWEEVRKGPLLEPSGGARGLPNTWILDWRPPQYEGINFCWVSHRVVVLCYGHPGKLTQALTS